MVKYLLVVDESVNWFAVFKGAKLPNGEVIQVDQARWKDLHVEARQVFTNPF